MIQSSTDIRWRCVRWCPTPSLSTTSSIRSALGTRDERSTRTADAYVQRINDGIRWIDATASTITAPESNGAAIQIAAANSADTTPTNVRRRLDQRHPVPSYREMPEALCSANRHDCAVFVDLPIGKWTMSYLLDTSCEYCCFYPDGWHLKDICRAANGSRIVT